MTPLPFTFEHWPAAVLAAAACVAIVVIATRRRPSVPRATVVFVATGAVLLALAAGGAAWLRPMAREITVYVDLSPSTRNAAYRGSAELRGRIAQLVGDKPYNVTHFAEHPEPSSAVSARLPDLPARQTILPPSDAPFILLFGDGRFAKAPSAQPPIYAIVDPILEHSQDAAVTSLAVNGDEVTIGVRNTGDTSRAMALQGVAGAGVVDVKPGAFSLARRIDPSAASISATFSPGDDWPENDALRTLRQAPAAAERWWVMGEGGGNAPDASWRVMTAANLPADVDHYLGASLVVFDNVAATELDGSRRAAIDRYVGELGGGLLILGGEHAFAAGGYAGTTLDRLSPLASTPPEPTTRWVLLADASGSMNQVAEAAPGATSNANRTRWAYAADAVAGAVKELPPADVVSIGSFADGVHWWSRESSVALAGKLPFPPADVHPRGETNLEAALRGIADDAAGAGDAKLPTQLLVATDAQATIAAPAELAALLKTRRITLHVLLIGDEPAARGLTPLRGIVATTGGTIRAERLPEQWAASVRELLRSVQPKRLESGAASVRFIDPLASVTAVSAQPWNRTWRKADATPIAGATIGGERVTMAARWNVGEGQVAAVAFHPPASIAEAVARLIERPPHDSRFRVSLDPASPLRISVDATDGNAYLNGERLTLKLIDETTGRVESTQPIAQTGPGRYELDVDAPAILTIARVRRGGGQTLTTAAVAGRYAPEFDAVGNDRAALAELARRTGGAVIEPGDTRRLDLPFPRKAVPLVSWLAAAGAALVAAGLVRWRVGS